MTTQPRPDELTQLRAEVAVLRAKVEQPRRHLPRRFLPLAIVTLLVALMPLSILAAGPTFSDLGTAAPVHQPNIQAIGDAGITTGFEDPNNPNARLYNPKGLVTREEMATFLARTAGLGANQPVLNARTALTAEQATNAGHAASADTATLAAGAQNATRVGGFAPDGLVRVGRAIGPNRADTTTRPDILPITASFSAPPLPATLQPVVSLTLTAPADGFVLVTGAVYIQLNANNGSYPSVYGRVRHIATGGASPALVCGSTATNTACSLTPTFIFPVGAGNQTFTLEAIKTASFGSAEAYDATITALFVPFGYNGGTTLAPTP